MVLARNSTRFLLSSCIAATLAVGLASGCHRTAPTRPPVVLIVVDTLRADHLPCYGYGRETAPAICGLANDGILFERAYSTRTETIPSIASILTGLYPPHHGLRANYSVLPDPVETVAERLAPLGYSSGGFVSSFVMIRDFSGFAQGFSVYDDDVQNPEGFRENFERPAAQTVDRALAWVGGAGATPFLFVHLIEPHGPYAPPAPFLERFAVPPGGTRLAPDTLSPYLRLPGVEFVAQLVARYDGEIAAADSQIDRLLGGLRQLDLFDRSLIVVTADHGESLGEDGLEFGHGAQVEDGESHVPLVIKPPAGMRRPVKGTRVAEPVSLTDVMPTILAAAGAPVNPSQVPGVDLLHIAGGGPRSRPAPLTERLGAKQLDVKAHDRDCPVHWTVPRREGVDASRWTDDARRRSASDPSEPSESRRDGCADRVAREVSDLVREALALEPPFPVTVHREVLRKGARREFIEQRGRGPEVPLDERSVQALRALGYAE